MPPAKPAAIHPRRVLKTASCNTLPCSAEATSITNAGQPRRWMLRAKPPFPPNISRKTKMRPGRAP
eukprot:4015911-Lingulodinium_polyedra.AAC.1